MRFTCLFDSVNLLAYLISFYSASFVGLIFSETLHSMVEAATSIHNVLHIMLIFGN